jgi:hypothetical protein
MMTAGLRPAKERPVSLKVGGGKRTRVCAVSLGKPSRTRCLSLQSTWSWGEVRGSKARGGSCSRR